MNAVGINNIRFFNEHYRKSRFQSKRKTGLCQNLECPRDVGNSLTGLSVLFRTLVFSVVVVRACLGLRGSVRQILRMCDIRRDILVCKRVIASLRILLGSLEPKHRHSCVRNVCGFIHRGGTPARRRKCRS